MSRYSKAPYEDVALVLSEKRVYFSHLYNDAQAIVAEQVVDRIVHSLADLFAADNPRICTFHLTSEHNKDVEQDDGCEMVGFNREQFLVACGLEPKGPFADCPLCGKPTEDGHAHKECADYEQALVDAQGEAQENLEAAEALYDHTVRGDS